MTLKPNGPVASRLRLKVAWLQGFLGITDLDNPIIRSGIISTY